VKENEDDVRLASLYKYYSLKNDQTDTETDDQYAKRKRIENESIFDNAKLSAKRTNSSSLSSNLANQTPSNTNSKEFKIESLRKRLSKSIEEKKISNLIESSPSDHVHLKKSLKFEIRKANETDDNNVKDEKKNGKLVVLNRTNDDTLKPNEKKLSLVSAQYSDTDSNESDAKT
jgi:hypothetical protein